MKQLKLFLRQSWRAIFPLVGVILSVLPLLRAGFAKGHDWPFELVRIAEFRFALIGGQMPPFWAPDLYRGFGSPIFLFYAPLYLAVSSALVPLTGSVMNAATAALVLFSIAGAALTWRLIRQVCPNHPSAARIGVVLYALQPYLLTDKWIRNANAEFAALSLLPGVLAGATARNARSAFWWTSLSLAGVILAHNITALIAIALAIAIPIFVHRKVRALIPVGLGILAALALTAFFWAPAFVFLPLIRSQDLLTGKFDFHRQFPEIASFFWPAVFYSGGWLTLPLLVTLLLTPVNDLHARRVLRALGIAALVLIFLMLPQSTWIWETAPLLRYAQFPWRLMGSLAVVLAIGGAIASTKVPPYVQFWSVELIVLVIALLNAWPTLRGYEPIPPPLAIEVERALTREGIQSRSLRATVYDEYLPLGASVETAHPEDGAVLFHKWAFPVWVATADGNPITVEQCSGGLACVHLPERNVQVSLALREPLLRKWGKAISGLTAAVLISLAIAVYWRLRSG